ncbi:MAG: hypothetical protein HC896_08285 [Bacteroidales bacterium]|nr:hypothetical protein [Bacteroidales bacterium]
MLLVKTPATFIIKNGKPTGGKVGGWQLSRAVSVVSMGLNVNFIPGIICAMVKSGKHAFALYTCDDWKNLINTGIIFSTYVCGHYHNYVTQAFANTVIR